jgi:ABC-type uncharacterized transport system substrate-binding protein
MVGLRDGLQALGYREGEQFVIGVRFTQGDIAALPAAARDLVQSGVDVIFATDANAARAAQLATNRIPIVFAAVVGDPVALGLVQSFARPGGNITGVTDTDLELSAKRLEIFKEMLSGLKRVLFAYDPSDPYAAAGVRAYRDAARHLGVVLLEKPVRTAEEARMTLSQLRRGEVDGIVAPSSLSLNVPGFVLDATSQRTIPSMFNGAFFVESGRPAARARLSLRTVPNMDGRKAGALLVKKLTANPPHRVKVTAKVNGTTPWWTTDPDGPAFEAARRALKAGFKKDTAMIGAGGSIGFVQPFADLLGGAPCLLMGVEDPPCNAHSENESLHLGDWAKCMRSAIHLYDELSRVAPSRSR